MKLGEFTWTDAQAMREKIRTTHGWKTRLREIKISSIVVEEDD